jgi:hypothetical protein
VRDAPTHKAGEAQAAAFTSSASVGSTPSGREELRRGGPGGVIGAPEEPVRHRINVRRTNLLERSFLEERRRRKVIPRLMDEKSAMKLVFATLIRVSERRSRVSFSELKRQRLKLLRRELAIEAPPSEKKREVRREGSEVA